MKSFGLILFGALAVISGVVIAVVLIKKRRRDGLIDFDDFDTVVSDEEFEHFFGTESDDDKDED